MRAKWILLAPVVLVGIAVFTFVGGWIVMQLWNWLLPPLFGWHTITFWQAWGLLALCRILFGGLGVHGASRSRMRDRMSQKWAGRSPEERERFRQKIREQFGFDPKATE